ncbi:MAG: DUF1549 domain-containing protein [Blastocatellia bacterium]|nr:DUF1549 domain-containing protein [Blastocatellia bacterium]
MKAFIALLMLLFGASELLRPAAGQSAVDFGRDIRPILADKCWICHGPDAAAKKIRLRLDTESSAKADLGGRRAIVPGRPEESELIKRITAEDPLARMPPSHAGRTLTDREIALLTEWVRQGAPWQGHWAFVAPVRPALPAVQHAAWPRNAIDHFVLARLEREGLRPAPEADRAMLLRRLSFDLTGLPPTAKELDDFLDDRSPNAYEKVVDRLLASPRYGERMAFKWLDAARYADTNGYQNDGDRSMWRWRDWVIEAFNRNQPYDQFVIEQLGGDLLPAPTMAQRIATGFNRNHRQNSEDGLIPEEYAVEYIVDRVDTTSTVFLGLTVGCARCHNHKYDPISQKEYYQLYAYFNSVMEDGRSSYHNSPPWIYAPTAAQAARLREMDDELARRQRRLDRLIRAQQRARRNWEASLDASGDGRAHWFPSDGLLLRHSFDAGAQPEFIEKQEERASAGYAAVPTKAAPDKVPPGFRDGAPAQTASPLGEGIALDGKPYFDAGRIANFDYSDRLFEHRDQFSLSLWFYADDENSGALVTHMQDRSEEKVGGVPKNRGYGLFLLNGRLHWNVISVWADDSWRVETADPVAPRQWHHVVAIFDGREPYERAQIYLDGRKQAVTLNNGRLFRTFADVTANLRIGAGAGPEYRFRGRIDEARVYQTRLRADEIDVLACGDSLAAIARIPDIQRTPGQRSKLLNAWLARNAATDAGAEWQAIRELRRRRTRLEREFPLVMVMQETPEPQPAFVLRRGVYDQPGERVARGLPVALQPAAAGPRPANRLEFGRWLMSAENPLTARVQVNRLWQMLFGTGLVKTVEDFGAQGEAPSHPDLLDWLATEFRDGSASANSTDNRQPTTDYRPWNLKALLKTIVTSATYRQSSAVPPALLQRDPENRLLARGPRFRLPAELIRDQALAVSGLLVERLGGPSVKPYQPEGLLKDMAFSNMTDYAQEKGEGLWRRSLYTYWKRTVLNPGMLLFDATAREQCTVRESRSNTPLQALNLMNDVTYIEAARLFAERVMKEGGTGDEARLVWAFRQATSRPPTEAERDALRRHLDAQRARYRGHAAEADRLLAVGVRRNDPALDRAELAAFTVTASLLLNLDEVITRQ